MTNLVVERAEHRLAALLDLAAPRVYGYVSKVVGLSVTVSGLTGRIGDLLAIGEGAKRVLAEVVAVDENDCTCLPLGEMAGIGNGDKVTSTGGPLRVGVSGQLRGRVLDGLGQPLDGRAIPGALDHVSVEMAPPAALSRQRVDQALPLGVRAIDSLISVGRGQRVGIFAGSGVGKSSLLSMIARGTAAADHRRRPDRRAWPRGPRVPRGRPRARGPAQRRGRGRHLGPAADGAAAGGVRRDPHRRVVPRPGPGRPAADGQPHPARDGPARGRPVGRRAAGLPGLPAVGVRAAAAACSSGPAAARAGSITGLYTVLVEGDDHNEPIADTARSILDGHIVLDRRLATAGHFPSIDVLESVSRVRQRRHHAGAAAVARRTRQLLAARRDVKELVEIGAYVAGSNPTADQALALWPALERFLQQDMDDQSSACDTWAGLASVLGALPAAAPVQLGGVRMSPRRWLPTVIRARQAQEDLLAQQVAAARRDVATAVDQLAAQEQRVAELRLPANLSVPEFHAEIANQQADLANLAAAAHRVQFADARLPTQLAGSTEAATVPAHGGEDGRTDRAASAPRGAGRSRPAGAGRGRHRAACAGRRMTTHEHRRGDGPDVGRSRPGWSSLGLAPADDRDAECGQCQLRHRVGRRVVGARGGGRVFRVVPARTFGRCGTTSGLPRSVRPPAV